MSDTLCKKEWLVPAESALKINGVPYKFVDETVISGFHEPTAPGPFSGKSEESAPQNQHAHEEHACNAKGESASVARA
jgi:hypothetical protein